MPSPLALVLLCSLLTLVAILAQSPVRQWPFWVIVTLMVGWIAGRWLESLMWAGSGEY